ncbi:glutathione transferase GstA [Litoreibacter arenae]|uniref:Glutathione S-transferase n=1 Tax=Litoreibacter arenae DSM 19593 TaxID=1123360 RepID=S9RK84_9RHOB|nr:glutathione transferase GstA [Litoreibacter arenae]EPX78525.1 Glutathione S-transferase [Litoreibacter arenae DSM 19593]
MKLYFMPGACSMAPHIALREAGLPFSLVEVDYRSRLTECGCDFLEINPKGYVPALVLENGKMLTEVPVILQFVDGLAPDAGLFPTSGMRRWRALEWLNFIATEIHKSFSPLFRPTTPEAFLNPGKDHLTRRMTVIEHHLGVHRYLMGRDFSLADVYLFAVCRWMGDQDLSIADWPALQRHFDDIQARPAVGKALAREGLTGTAVVPDQLADCDRSEQLCHSHHMQHRCRR